MKIGYIVGLVIVVVLGLGAAVLASNLMERERSSKPAAATPYADSTPGEQESIPEAAEVGDKDAIQARINRFVSIYYGRPSDLYRGSMPIARERLADRLRPYVTEAFLVGYLPPLDTPPDIWNKRNGAEVTARVDASSVLGHFDDSETAEETLRVVITPVVNGVKQQRRTIDIALALVKDEEVWRIDQLEELYL